MAKEYRIGDYGFAGEPNVGKAFAMNTAKPIKHPNIWEKHRTDKRTLRMRKSKRATTKVQNP